MGGELGRLRILLRTGSVVPDGPPDPELRLDRTEPPAPKRQRWIARLFDADSPTQLLTLGRNGEIYASAFLEEAGRGQHPLLLSIVPKNHSADPDFAVRVVEGDELKRGNGQPEAVPSLGHPFVDPDSGGLWFTTGRGPLTEAMIDARGDRAHVTSRTDWPGLASGERVAAVLDVRWGGAGGHIVHARLDGGTVNAETDEAIWVGDRLVIREGKVPPDFVAITPRTVSPRIVGRSGTAWLVACELRLPSESAPGGGALIAIYDQAATPFVSLVWGTASPSSQVAAVERWFLEPSAARRDASHVRAAVRAKRRGGRESRGLVAVPRPDFDIVATTLAQPIEQRIAEGRKVPDFLANRKAPAGPGGEAQGAPSWLVPLHQAAAEERAFMLGPVKFAEARRVRRFSDPGARPPESSDDPQLLVRVGDPAPGLPQGTSVRELLHADSRLLVALVASSVGGEPRRACWHVATENGKLLALILYAVEGSTLEVRPGDRRRIATVDIDPAHAFCGDGTRGFGDDLGELLVYRLAFTDGTEGIFAARTSQQAYIPAGRRPLGGLSSW